MSDDTQGTTTAEETTAPAIPTENKPAEPSEPTLPDGVAERTKEEFEKLKKHNLELKNKLSQFEQPKTSVLDDIRPAADVPMPPTPSLKPAQVQEIKESLVDENGYVDVARLESKLKAAESEASEAKQRAAQAEARMQRFEESAQVRAAHAEFPQLNPNSPTFDPKFYDLVKNELIGQMMRGEQDMMRAAKKASELYTPKADVTKAKEEAVEEFKTKVAKRDMASESGTGRGAKTPIDREELIRKTRQGDSNALYKRLQASGN
jgi:hypothetical protein